MSSGQQWWFRERGANEKARDPIGSEFFTEDSISDPARALVRESVQNVLDARRASAPIRIRFGLATIPRERADRYLGGLAPHVTTVVPSAAAAFAEDSCRLLTIEDFGTTGLTGSVESIHVPDGERNNYFSFIWAEGASSKGSGDIGRWGLGKFVFRNSSRIFTFFALTVQHPDGGTPIVREDGEGRLLIGLSVLKNHRIDESDFAPDGYWADQPEIRALPMTDGGRISEFCSDWSVTRGPVDGGLSLVVPHVDEQVTASALISAITVEYFIAIDRGNVAFDVVDADGAVTRIDATTLESVVEALQEKDRDRIRRSLDLLRWYAGLADGDIIELPQGVDAESLSDRITDEIRAAAAPLIAGGEGRLAVRVPISIRKDQNGERARWTSFVVLFDAEPGAPSEQVYTRGGLIIPDVRSRVNHPGIRSLLLAEERTVVEFLGDAEDPGHTQWKEHGDHFRGRYEKGAARLSFVRRFAGLFVRALRQDQQERVDDYLNHWLSVPAEPKPPTRPPSPPTPPPGGGVVRPPVVIATGRRPWRMERDTDGTFRIFAAARDGESVDVTVEFAYDVIRGDAFKRFDPLDFSLEPEDHRIGPPVHPSGPPHAAIVVIGPNSVEISGARDGDVFEFRGFDPNRDVEGRVLPRRARDSR